MQSDKISRKQVGQRGICLAITYDSTKPQTDGRHGNPQRKIHWNQGDAQPDIPYPFEL